MQSLTSGLYTEDFFYGYPYDSVQVQKPPQFDYAGSVPTNAGRIVAEPGEFTMHFGAGEANPDVAAPYGGAPASAPYYLRFPVLSWESAAGLFLEVTTTEAAELSFDRSFSGYVGDRLVVTVNDLERLSITGSAGYPWTRSTITLPKGTSRIAIALATAPYASATVVREGVAQASSTATELLRYLRLANLSITHVAAVPTAASSALFLFADSSATLAGTVQVTSGPLLWSAQAKLLAPTKAAAPAWLSATASLTLAAPAIGATAELSLVAEASLSLAPTLESHTASDNGGFGFASSASLLVESTATDISALIRPLKRTSLRMSRPVVVAGRPQSMRAISETEAVTDVTGALVLTKINPYGPNNVVPASAGSLVRWASIDARRDLSGEVVEWAALNGAGPSWSTPGAYRPTVSNFVQRQGSSAVQLPYPGVHFDALHLDHLLIDLGTPVRQMSWVFVGSFARFRGQLADSCPILDFAPAATVDYHPAGEPSAVRGNFDGWVDAEPAESVYFGLSSYGRSEPTTSRVALRTDDVTGSFVRSDWAVVSDNTPVVAVYVLDGANSYVLITPLVTTGRDGYQLAATPRAALAGDRATFALGRSRLAPPFGGQLATGTMSLLEVAYADHALSVAAAQELTGFYASLYAASTANTVAADVTAGFSAAPEQLLIYGVNPETDLALISGDRSVVFTGLKASSAEGAALIASFVAQDVPVVACTNRDYASMVARLEGL